MGNGFIDKFWGFGDGWDFLRNNIHGCKKDDTPPCGPLGGGGLSADALLGDAKKVLEKTAKPLFLYIGTIDSHVSWRAHEPWISKYDSANGPYNGLFVKACLDPQLDKIVLGQMKISERDKTRIIALYDSDVSYNDKVLGELFDELKKLGHADDTMVILTSDHGEELWDHGRIGHGQSLREELVHVPLLIYYPPYFPAGRVVEEGVDVLDILPTITDALGAPTPDGVQGESLIPLAQGVGAGYPRPAIASQYELAHTMRLGAYKLWVGGSGEVKLFDAATDAHEEHDLAQTRNVERRVLTDAMGLWMANRNAWKKRRWGSPSNLLPAFATDTEH
jgi:arylsulfatase A-like enzyme